MAYTLSLCIKNHQQAITLLHGSRYTLLQTFFFLLRNYRFIYHNLDIVIFITVQLHAMHNLLHITVYTHIQVSFLAYLFE